MWVWIVIVGIVLNFVTLMQAADGQPEGAMGMAVVIPFCFVPYLLFVLMLGSKAVDWIKNRL